MTTSQTLVHVPSLAHVYFDVKADRLVGEVDIVLPDGDQTIVETSNVTADGLPASELVTLVDSQLDVLAGLRSTDWDAAPVAQFRNFDGRVGYLTSARIVES